MKPETPTEKSIFLDALDIESPSDRATFVEDACQGNPELQWWNRWSNLADPDPITRFNESPGKYLEELRKLREKKAK